MIAVIDESGDQDWCMYVEELSVSGKGSLNAACSKCPAGRPESASLVERPSVIDMHLRLQATSCSDAQSVAVGQSLALETSLTKRVRLIVNVDGNRDAIVR